jgi:hypothetical protein
VCLHPLQLKKRSDSSETRGNEGEVMQTKLLAVLLKSARRHVKADVELEIAASALRLPSGISKSTLARRLELLVENPNEPERPVVIEMLRHVVLGNFGAINGRRGEKAQGVLDQMYPSGGALPGFHRSNWDNASGMFVRNACSTKRATPRTRCCAGCS